MNYLHTDIPTMAKPYVPFSSVKVVEVIAIHVLIIIIILFIIIIIIFKKIIIITTKPFKS